MSDYNSSLPVKTQSAGDVIAKISDATTPSQQLKVESDGSINVNAAISPNTEVKLTDGTDTATITASGELNVLATAQPGVDIGDVTINNGSGAAAVNIQDGGNSITVDGSVTVSSTDLDIRDLVFATDKVDASGTTLGANSGVDIGDVTINNAAGASAVNIQDGGNSITVDGSVTVSATDLDIRDLSATSDSVTARMVDESGNAFTNTNPLPVSFIDVEGTEVNNYDTASAIAAAATSNHDYTASGAFKLRSIEATASGKAKIEVQVETAAGSNTFNTIFVQFNSTSSPNMSVKLTDPASVVSGARVRVIRTNRDNQAQDLYSTISGFLV